MSINKIRLSAGTAAILGMRQIKMKTPPTTAYLMLHSDHRCRANCGFCPQAREARSNLDHLSRISWPPFPFVEFLEKIVDPVEKGKLFRVCIQTINYPGMFDDLKYVVRKLAESVSIKISTAISPLEFAQLKELKQLGIERVGIALDACTADIFDEIKGKKQRGIYRWDAHVKSLQDALEIFGRGYVSTHLIVGLGESEYDLLNCIENVSDLGVLPGLFAFTPIKGTRLEDSSPPKIAKYRKIQLGRFLIVARNKRVTDFEFNVAGELLSFGIGIAELREIVALSHPFQTTGCPGCNRPYYTSRPTGVQFNYPVLLSEADKTEIVRILTLYVDKN